ncbi:MAG: glycosyltransferase family 4 protein [Actinomycetota bacterium]
MHPTDSAEPLNIAMVAPPWFELPPSAYGGIEWMCYWLAEGLTSRGHRVTAIGAGNDNLSGDFISTFDDPPSDRITDSIVESIHIARAARHMGELKPDVIHDHTLSGPLLSFDRSVPTVVTAHGPIVPDIADYYGALGDKIALVAISNAQRRTAEDLPWASTVYNAIPVDEYPFRAEKEEFILFLGRMNAEKAPHLAIEAGRAAGVPVVLAGKCSEPLENEFFEQKVKPLLGPDVDWIGEADTEKKKDLLSRARCLIMPIQWEEPFGLVMIEAMACGTPVVALQAGSVPEVVDHGTTGFVCARPDELPGAVGDVDSIDASACRDHVLRNFDVSVMVKGYERAYREVLSRAA